MTNTNALNFSQNSADYLAQAVLYHDVIHVNTEHGNAVLLSEEEYSGLLETLRLLSIPGMEERLKEGLRVPVEECDDFAW